MTTGDRQLLIEQLIEHEGLRLVPYRDPGGVLTVGVGRNLTSKGLSVPEVLTLLDHDIDDAIHAATAYPWFVDLDPVRQRVIADMIFNLGPTGFSLFPKLIHAMAVQNYPQAAEEMLKSQWARQVKSRAVRLARMMERGE